jgi:hypothetical protein
MGMERGVGQDLAYDAPYSPAALLVLFLYNLDSETGPDRCPLPWISWGIHVQQELA